MDLVKKVIVLVCSIILVGFTLTDFHSVIAEDPAYAGHLFVNKPEKQTLTAHEKKSHPDSDANREEAGIMWKYLRSENRKRPEDWHFPRSFWPGRLLHCSGFLKTGIIWEVFSFR